MRLTWLELRDFRPYRDLRFEPASGLNILIGDNGAGKTSVLEAIAYLSRLRSFRMAPDDSLVRTGTTGAIIRGGLERESGELRIEVELPVTGRRRVLVNGKRPPRFSAVASEVPMVAFLPDDLDLVKRGPSLRRDYLDDLGAQLSPAAAADQADYDKALRQRNSLLRRDGRHTDPMTLDVWDERISTAGARVAADRLRLLAKLGPHLVDAYAGVDDGGAKPSWAYESSWARLNAPDAVPDTGGLEERLREALMGRRARDMEQRTTSAGPHRDDPYLLLDLRPVRTQASQGEQRSVALSMRLAAYHLLEDRHRRPPILLLDDVFSELDPRRARGVIALLPRGQVFVTSAREDEVPATGVRWRVENTAVTAMDG